MYAGIFFMSKAGDIHLSHSMSVPGHRCLDAAKALHMSGIPYIQLDCMGKDSTEVFVWDWLVPDLDNDLKNEGHPSRLFAAVKGLNGIKEGKA